MENLKKGLLWSAIDRFSVIFIQILIEILLARMIAPVNYGIIGLASMFIVFGNVLLDSGFSKALIQDQNRNKSDFSTMFYLNIGISILVYIILFIISEYIADYFKYEELSIVIKILSLNIVLTGLTLIQRTKLTIDLNYKTQAKISLVSIIIAGFTSTIMAYKGLGIWALVCQTLITNLISLILYYINNPIFPSIRDVTLQSFKKLINFGGPLTISSLIQALYQNSFTFLIGKEYTANKLGMYNKVNQFTLMPISVLTNIVNRVTYPELSKMQSENEKLGYVNYKFAEYFSYVIFPFFIALASVNESFIKIFLGDMWIESVNIFTILSISYMFYPFTVMNMTLFQIKDRTKLFFRIDLVSKLISFLLLCYMLKFGIIWVCISILISQVLQFILSTIFSYKLLQFKTSKYFRSLIINLIYFAFIYVVVLKINNLIENHYSKLIFSLIMFLFSTLFLIKLKDKALFEKIKLIVSR